MLEEKFVIGFVIPSGAESMAHEIAALNESMHVDVVVVVTDDERHIAEATALEAVTFEYSVAEALDPPAVAALNAYFASEQTFITGASDPLLIVVEGAQPALTYMQINWALEQVEANPNASSIQWGIKGAEMTLVSHDKFMKSGQVMTDDALVFLTRPN